MGFGIPCVLACVFFLAALRPADALPPAPPHTFFGDVRDEFGFLLPADGSKVVVSQGGQIVAQEAILGPGNGFNYRIELAMDLRLAGSADYISTAVATGEILTIRVDVGGVAHVPIEVSATGPAVGAPAQATRLDLTLGVDSDGDGLPDAWEINELYYGGASPGPGGWDLAAIAPDGDYDGDGFSNRLEYIAGTYATDATSFHRIRIASLGDAEVEFRIHTMLGKNYALESSTDLKAWVPVDMRLANQSGYSARVQSSTTGEVSAFCARTPAAAKSFYRLVAR